MYSSQKGQDIKEDSFWRQRRAATLLKWHAPCCQSSTAVWCVENRKGLGAPRCQSGAAHAAEVASATLPWPVSQRVKGYKELQMCLSMAFFLFHYLTKWWRKVHDHTFECYLLPTFPLCFKHSIIWWNDGMMERGAWSHSWKLSIAHFSSKFF